MGVCHEVLQVCESLEGLGHIARREQWEEVIRASKDFDEFIEEVFVELRPIAYKGHPSDHVIADYLAGRLKDEWRLSDMAMLDRLMKGELGEDWRMSEVSLHIMTCKICAEKVARLREEEMASIKG